MYLQKIIKSIVIVLIFSSAISCSDDDDNNTTNNTNALNLLYEGIASPLFVGSTSSISYNSHGQAFESHQSGSEINSEFVSDFSYDIRFATNVEKWNQNWIIDSEYFFEVNLEFSETVNGLNGTTNGVTGLLVRNFQALNVPNDPMYSTKLAARRKNIIMSSPLSLLKLIMNKETIESGLILSTEFNTSAFGLGANTEDIFIEINPDTGKIKRSFTKENDPLLGDVLYEIYFDEWIQVGAISLPSKLTHVLDGNIIREENFSNISLNTDIDDINLTSESIGVWQYNQIEAIEGYNSSQFHYRMQFIGVPIDFPTNLTSSNFQPPLILSPSTALSTDPDVFVVAGDLQIHYSFAFKIGNELLLYDTPYNNRKTIAIRNEIASNFSTNPITKVVISHNHFDHSGGWRGALTNGSTLLIGGSDEVDKFNNYANRPHIVSSNPLDGINYNIEAVNNGMSFGQGNQEIQLHILNNIHADDENFVLIYKPSTKTLFLPDLFNPGFQLVYQAFTPNAQQSMKDRANEVFSFIQEKGWDIQRVYGTHGFTDENSTLYSNLIELINL